jgi:SAM-dependent methyltransferase
MGGPMRVVHADANFTKYAEVGAYHWREVGRGLIAHNAFTAERYRLVIDRAAAAGGHSVLDYGCGDGTLLGVMRRRLSRIAMELHGYDPNPLAVELAKSMLVRHGTDATLHRETATLPSNYFDRVICTEVIEHASSPSRLLDDIARVLKPGGRAVITTPIRLTEEPLDANHVREWFPGEFARLFDSPRWRLLSHEQLVPAAAAEIYFWRPVVFARIPVFRLLSNLLSIYGGVNALSWLRARPRLFMLQIVVVERTA